VKSHLLLFVASALVLVMPNAHSEGYHCDVSLTQALIETEELVSASCYCQRSSAPAGGVTPRLAPGAYNPLLDRADQPCGIAVTPDGSTLYVTANKSHNVVVIDVATHQILDCIDPTQGGSLEAVVDDIAITSNGTWALVTNPVWRSEFDGSVTILALGDNSVANTISFPNSGISQPRASADGSTVFVAGSWPSRIFVIDVPTASITNTIDLSTPGIDLRTYVMAFTPDGETLYALGTYGSPDSCRLVSIDTTAQVVDQNLTVSIPNAENFSHTAVSPNGESLYAVHGEERKVYVLDLQDNGAIEAEISFPQEQFLLWTVEFSLDGSRAYVGGDTPGGIFVIDTSTHLVIDHITDFPANAADMHALELAPDGGLLFVTGSNADAVFFVDTATHEVAAYINLNPVDVWPQQIAVSPDGRRAYTAGAEYASDGQGRVYVVDTELRAVVEHIPIVTPLALPGSSTDFQALDLSPDGTLLYTGACARLAADPGHLLALVVDLTSGQVAGGIDLGSIQADVGDKVAVSPSGHRVYFTLVVEQCLLVASTQSLTLLSEIPVGFEPIDLELSSDGQWAYVSGGGSGISRMAIVSLATNTVEDIIVGTTDYPPPCPGLGLASNTNTAWLGSNNRVEIVDLATHTIVDDVNLVELLTAGDTGAACPYGITFDPSGRNVFVANFDSNNVMILDAETHVLLHKLRVGFSPSDVGVSPDGLEAYVLNSDSESISVIDVNEGEVVATISLRELGTPETASTFRVTSRGNVLTDGTFFGAAFETGKADVAEWVAVSEPVDVGDVLELDPSGTTLYRVACTPCSSLVAGVVSTEPGVVLGQHGTFEQSALLALTGIVPVKVTDEGGPILPGDLLVTSSIPGHAMRWPGPDPCPCALVGKALEPMTDEAGVILVLLTTH
jgi:YVTN family beta-propeller protein